MVQQPYVPDTNVGNIQFTNCFHFGTSSVVAENATTILPTCAIWYNERNHIHMILLFQRDGVIRCPFYFLSRGENWPLFFYTPFANLSRKEKKL